MVWRAVGEARSFRSRRCSTFHGVRCRPSALARPALRWVRWQRGSRGSRACRPTGVGPREIPHEYALGVARARWPIRSSKPAGRGSPTVGRFDSCAAPLDRKAHGWAGNRVHRASDSASVWIRQSAPGSTEILCKCHSDATRGYEHESFGYPLGRRRRRAARAGAPKSSGGILSVLAAAVGCRRQPQHSDSSRRAWTAVWGQPDWFAFMSAAW